VNARRNHLGISIKSMVEKTEFMEMEAVCQQEGKKHPDFPSFS
jgi:hypothetical protein